MDRFSLDCSVQSGVEYNALINNVLINNEFVSDPTLLSGYAPAGDVSITVLARNNSYPAAVGCNTINARFRTFAEILAWRDALTFARLAWTLHTQRVKPK